MTPARALRRTIDRFLEDPTSIRIVATLIIGATVTAVVVGAVVMRLFDHREYPNIGRATWFTLQTVTTVGYGDVTPRSAIGRLVASAVMLIGIGFITLVTAAITSIFVEANRRGAAKALESSGSAEPARTIDPSDLAGLTSRLDQIEATLTVLVEQTRQR